MNVPAAVLGWDIGGVNTKSARLTPVPAGPAIRSASLPYELKPDPSGLSLMLAAAARQVGSQADDHHAVTMTAELSQAFRTKREGVGFVLDALGTAFPGAQLHVYSVDGCFLGPGDARQQPLSVAAANWAATAALVARWNPTCVLIDIGSTSADLIPIADGRVVAQGRTDPERLCSGELVYTGALRTPVEAVARQVPLWGGTSAVAADGFAIIGDAHLWLGRISAGDYTCRPPDGGLPNRETAAERLARVVCGDRDMLDDSAIDRIAVALAGAQVRTVAEGLRRILNRWPGISTAVVTGLGDFIATEAALSVGLKVLPLAARLGDAARTAPAAAVAWLLWDSLERRG